MKVFVLTTELNSHNGWGRYSLGVLDALIGHGVEVVVATGRYGNNESTIDSINILPRFLDYNRNYFLAFLYAWKLRKYTKDCDAIHSFVEPYSYIAYWLSKLTNKKYFISAHGTRAVLPYRISFLKRHFHKKSFTSAHKIICVSNYTKKLLLGKGLKNLLVVNNGISFERFSQNTNIGLDKRDNIILTVGALKYRKGQHVSLMAFAQIAKKFKNLKYYFVGDKGDSVYLEKLKKIIIDFDIKERVVFLSDISNEELISLYGRSKVFILTSISKNNHFEGFGLVYLEANASGAPVIGSRNSGAEDAIQNGETGFLVEQESPESIAQAIEKMLEDEHLWKEMSKNAVNWAKERDWSVVAQEYVRIYQLL